MEGIVVVVAEGIVVVVIIMFLPFTFHCSQRGSEIICWEFSHTFLLEQGGLTHVLHVW